YNAAPLHGDLDQRSRTQTLDRFKTGDVRLLVASDVAARGLDIPDVSHIFNYEPSRHAEDFVHRVGRTGRAGKSGEAYTLAAPADSKSITAIEKLIGKTLERVSVEGIPETALGDTSDRGGWGREREERRTRRRGPRSEASRSNEAQAPREEPPAPVESRSEPAPPPERVRQDRPRQDRSDQDRQRRHEPREDSNADGVAGFGGEAPAFLTRAAKT
ncbi:MAG: C-terminal helicase domain-containing protein, partial [Pseudomonadota bacterium]